MKKIITILCLAVICFYHINPVLALNTKSIDLELSSSQHLSIADGDQTGLDLNSDFTFEAWVKIESALSGGDLRIIFAKVDSSAWSTISYEFMYQDFSGTEKLRITFSDGVTNHQTDIRADYTLSVGTWTHIAISADISVPSGQFYVNSSSITTNVVNDTATAINNSAEAFRIGCRNSSGSPVLFWDGLIDEVRVYNDIRTPTEISTNYQQEIPADTQGLVGYWKLNNSLLDETANNNDLTNNNSAVFSSSVPFTGAVEFIPQILIY